MASADDKTSAASHGQYTLHETTSSRCVTDTFTGTHNFEVADFSLLDGMGIGKFVSSRDFTVSGRDWNIMLYPDGNRTQSKGYISVFLHFLKGEVGTRVKFSMSLRLADKDEQVSGTSQYTFHLVDESCGWYRFIKKSKLRTLLPPKIGCFTIKCVLTVMDEPHAEDVITSTTVLVPEPKLHQDLTQMLKNTEGADVTFSVGGQLFPAHKNMLAARSMVFKAELLGAMKERAEQCIKIEDMEPATFEALLHFVYTDSLPDDCDHDADSSSSFVAMQHLLVAADRYGLDRLRKMCEAKLCRDIDVETVAITLLLAEQHHCTQLKHVCLGFIASRNMLGAVMKTEGLDHLITTCPLVMKEILDKIAAAGIE